MLHIYNANYNLNRGMATSLLLIIIILPLNFAYVQFFVQHVTDIVEILFMFVGNAWYYPLLIFVFIILVLRMCKFGKLYASELFLSFIVMTSRVNIDTLEE